MSETTSTIHPTALVSGEVAPGCTIGAYTIIHPNVKLLPTASIGSHCELGSAGKSDTMCVIGAGAIVGSHCSIGSDTVIGDNTHIGSNTVLTGTVRIGADCRISNHNSIGTPPQHIAPKVKKGMVVIGDRVVLRDFCSIHMPAFDERTTVGDDCFIMAYCHISHDVEVGHHVTMAIGATLAGHVKVEPFATLGMHVVVHQYLRIGAYSMIGMNATITKNVWPYSTMIGATFKKINEHGLRRCGLEGRIPLIKSAFDMIRENVQKAEQVQDETLSTFYRAARVPKFYPPRTG